MRVRSSAAVVAEPPGSHDLAAAGRTDGRSGRRADVDAGVQLSDARDWDGYGRQTGW